MGCYRPGQSAGARRSAVVVISLQKIATRSGREGPKRSTRPIPLGPRTVASGAAPSFARVAPQEAFSIIGRNPLGVRSVLGQGPYRRSRPIAAQAARIAKTRPGNSN